MPLSHRLLATILFPALLASARTSAQNTDNLAFQRAQHLRRGINTSDWFAQSSDYSVQRLRTFTTPDDIRLIHQLGFDHIRLSIDAEPLLAWQRKQPNGIAFIEELDSIVKLAIEQKLGVVIDLHPQTRYKQSLLQGDESIQRFAMLWRSLATHFASFDPDFIFFEIMNEPEQPDRYRWQGIQSLIAEQIRSAAPNNTIIACGARWSGLEDLLPLQPLALLNIIYTFHDYEPFAFTHQGATWTDPAVQPLRNVPYPSTPENIAKNLDQEPTLSGQFFVQQYGLARWDAHRIDITLSFAERWSQLHHAPVYVGEFGVHRPYADSAARAQWLKDMRTMLEKHHLGWAMWDYQDNFGAVTKKDGQTTPAPAVIEALGLTTQLPAKQ
ncbi:MAG: Endoglucanase [Edaphobacter sp.]|nr:Endoglucanase [Edaphobacter sp.]